MALRYRTVRRLPMILDFDYHTVRSLNGDAYDFPCPGCQHLFQPGRNFRRERTFRRFGHQHRAISKSMDDVDSFRYDFAGRSLCEYALDSILVDLVGLSNQRRHAHLAHITMPSTIPCVLCAALYLCEESIMTSGFERTAQVAKHGFTKCTVSIWSSEKGSWYSFI